MDNKTINALEAILFIYGEALPFKKAAGLLNVKPEEMKDIIMTLSERLKDTGLSLVVNDGAVQLVTHPDFGNMVETIVKDELSEELTPATLETLAIIAYLGPIPRSKVDFIRGVNSSYIIRNLSLRGLIERIPDPHRGNVYLYQASFDLLRHLGIQSKMSLPDYSKYEAMLTKAAKEGDLATSQTQKDASGPAVENTSSENPSPPVE